MRLTLRLLFAIVGAICGIIVLATANGSHPLIATGVGLIVVASGLVAP